MGYRDVIITSGSSNIQTETRRGSKMPEFNVTYIMEAIYLTSKDCNG